MCSHLSMNPHNRVIPLCQFGLPRSLIRQAFLHTTYEYLTMAAIDTHRLGPIYSSATIICEDLFSPPSSLCILKATMDIKGVQYYRTAVNYNNNGHNNEMN